MFGWSLLLLLLLKRHTVVKRKGTCRVHRQNSRLRPCHWTTLLLLLMISRALWSCGHMFTTATATATLLLLLLLLLHQRLLLRHGGQRALGLLLGARSRQGIRIQLFGIAANQERLVEIPVNVIVIEGASIHFVALGTRRLPQGNRFCKSVCLPTRRQSTHLGTHTHTHGVCVIFFKLVFVVERRHAMSCRRQSHVTFSFNGIVQLCCWATHSTYY